MAEIKDVKDLASALHEAGAINLETKLSDVLRIPGVGELTPGSRVSSGAVAWDGYVLVYKGLPAGVNELQEIQKGKTNILK